MDIFKEEQKEKFNELSDFLDTQIEKLNKLKERNSNEVFIEELIRSRFDACHEWNFEGMQECIEAARFLGLDDFANDMMKDL